MKAVRILTYTRSTSSGPRKADSNERGKRAEGTTVEERPFQGRVQSQLEDGL
jgi:hypothetical protein